MSLPLPSPRPFGGGALRPLNDDPPLHRPGGHHSALAMVLAVPLVTGPAPAMALAIALVTSLSGMPYFLVTMMLVMLWNFRGNFVVRVGPRSSRGFRIIAWDGW